MFKVCLEEEGCVKVDDKVIEVLRRRLVEVDREKNFMAFVLEDGEEKVKECEVKIFEFEVKVKEFNDVLNEVKVWDEEEDLYTVEVRLNLKRFSSE